MKAILCLDLATRTGWAMAALNPHGKIQIQSGVETFNKPGHIEGAGMRFLRFRNWLDEMAKMADLERVAFEEVKQRPASVAAGHVYGGLMGHLTAWCEERSVPYEGQPVQTIKKHATGKGNASKDEVKAAMTAKGHTFADDNEADALALLHYVLTYATPSPADRRPAPDRKPEGRVQVAPVRLPRRPVSR